MLQYLIILLDDAATSFCHYDVQKRESRLMPLDVLKEGIFWAMKENLNVQFVYPEAALPASYEEAVESIDHVKIKPASAFDGADIVVLTDEELEAFTAYDATKAYVWRTRRELFFRIAGKVPEVLRQVARLNVVFTDVPQWTEADLETYRSILDTLGKEVETLYTESLAPQINLLTDRMMLEKANHCGAGDNSVTLAPDGRFYVCPAFYQSVGGYAVGSLKDGLDIRNAQLYRLDHAPLCRKCDAWQCKRCVWLNQRMTLEVNTPSREQCVMAHLERNAARTLMLNLRRRGTFLPEREAIPEIAYLDPFDVRDKW